MRPGAENQGSTANELRFTLDRVSDSVKVFYCPGGACDKATGMENWQDLPVSLIGLSEGSVNAKIQGMPGGNFLDVQQALIRRLINFVEKTAIWN